MYKYVFVPQKDSSELRLVDYTIYSLRMNFRISQFFFILFYQQRFEVEGSRPLTAINNSGHAWRLFMDLRNDAAPSEEDDPSFVDRHARKRICREITNSGFFDHEGLEPVVMNNVRETLMNEHADTFHRIYVPRTSSNPVKQATRPFKYYNPFKPMEFQIESWAGGMLHFATVTEHVIACVLKRRSWSGTQLVTRYVTKQYNVFGDPYILEDPYKAGRFILQKEEIDESHARVLYESVGLAEEPAKTDEKYNDSDVKLELRYLKIREYREPAENDDNDPLCRLMHQLNYWWNQHYRLCVAIFRSPKFVDKFAYPKRSDAREYGCTEIEVSFKTLEARQIAFGKRYRERVAKCSSVSLASRQSISIYISRAYTTERLFIFQRKSNGRVYLENLSSDIAIVDIPSHAFEDVED